VWSVVGTPSALRSAEMRVVWIMVKQEPYTREVHAQVRWRVWVIEGESRQFSWQSRLASHREELGAWTTPVERLPGGASTCSAVGG
jgi:hypothetical protein